MQLIMRLDNEMEKRFNLQNWLANSVRVENYKNIATILEIETADVVSHNGNLSHPKGQLVLEQRIIKKMLNISSNQ